jgi:uncharacterized protein (DUF1684 family)
MDGSEKLPALSHALTCLLLLLATDCMQVVMAQKVFEERREQYYRQSAIYEHEIRQWQISRESSLKHPDGWLALAGFEWLTDGSSSMGSGEDVQIRLPGGPDYWGTISVRDSKVAFLPADDSGVLVNGKAVPLAALVVDDQGEPTIVSAGNLSFHVIRREQLAIRVRDREAPLLTSFTGLEYFPVDPKWRVRAKYLPHPPGTSISITNVLGQEVEMPNPGALQFRIDDKIQRLEALVEEGSDQLFLVMTDATSGRQTYGAGRFLYVDYPNLNGVTEIDFNKAYNPPCAFTSFSTCPLPPSGNNLNVPIEAGEKLYRTD